MSKVESSKLELATKTMSKKAKMKRSISDCIAKNNSNQKVKELTVCLGARVLALKDKSKHKWKEATIVRITESGQKLSSPIKSGNAKNISKMIKASNYTVKFDTDDDDDDYEGNALFTDDNYAESRVFGENNENAQDSSPNQSDESDSHTHEDSLDERSSSSRNHNSNNDDVANKKRKVARKTGVLNAKSSGRCKKRTMRNAKTSNITSFTKLSLDSFKNGNVCLDSIIAQYF